MNEVIDIFKEAEIANRELKINMYKLMGEIAILGGLNLKDGSCYWFKVEETIENENPLFALGLKYKDCSVNAFEPLFPDDMDKIIEITKRYKYIIRSPVPREMKQGFFLILIPA